MKKVFITFLLNSVLALVFSNSGFAQAPEGFVYQAELRNDKGRTLSNSNVSLDIRILTQKDNVEDWVWRRIYDVSTDKFGLVSVMVEDVNPPTDANKLFSEINWGKKYHYLYVEVNDGTGWVSMGEPALLMSVPYSLYSNKAGYADNAGNAINTENLNYGDVILYTENGFVGAKFEFYYRDQDGDNYGIENISVYSPVSPPGYALNIGDCDDDEPTVHLGAEEICDGIDNNCDGQIDETCDNDGDGFTAIEDCDDNNPDVYPGATEWCDGVDNNCDEVTDENCNCIDGTERSCGSNVGACAPGIQTCINGQWTECQGQVLPTDEICDGIDNDCDGQVDEGLTDSDVNNCGACGAVCSIPHASVVCVAGVCVLDQCEAGWADCDGNPSNGCEVDLSTVNNCGACGVVCPDGYICVDGNCIITNAIFVSPNGDDTSAGDANNPVLTISHGLDQAVNQGLNNVVVAEGTYNEIVTLVSGVNLLGGYNSTTWEVDGVSSISGGEKVTNTNETIYVGMIANGITSSTLVSNFNVSSPNAGDNGLSSYAIYILNSNALTLENCTANSGNGSNGRVGQNGIHASNTPAPNGSSGANGYSYNTICDDTRLPGGSGGSNSLVGRTSDGGNGGAGGSMDTDCTPIFDVLGATAGLSGANAYVYSYPSGIGGAGGNPDSPGQNGANGRTIHGNGGAGGLAVGSVINYYWQPTTGYTGTLGSHGTGGGGGGGAGGSDEGTDSKGSSGGGGGAGGARSSQAGYGGQGGGSSFGIFMIASDIVLRNFVAQPGSGGSGGNGGNSGVGQPGGAGGAGGTFNYSAGNGGNGGDGGNSGAGGGGTGGSSYGIYGISSTVNYDQITYNSGQGGIGGQGGTGTPSTVVGKSGVNGQSSNSDGTNFNLTQNQ